MNTLTQMCHSFVFLYLSYCIEIWGYATAKHLDPFIQFQKKSTRAKTFSELSAPSDPLFQRTNILSFDKSVGDLPKPISDLFQTNNNYHSYSTLNSQCL